MSTATFSLTSDAAGDPDSPIRVVVTPSQSAYFAGETLSVTITFTNTRTYSPEGEAGPSSRAGAASRSARTHKRASHSVSSAPIARPPTSSAGLYRPRTPVTAAGSGSPAPSRQTSLGPEDGKHFRRRGLIGKSGSEKDKSFPDPAEQRRRKMLSKSLSLDLGLCQDEGEIQSAINRELVKTTSYMQRSFTADSHLLPSSPKVPSPLARSESLPLSSKHPHARKQSLMDGTQFPYSSSPIVNGSDISTSPTSLTSGTSTTSTANTLASAASSAGPSTPSASASSFSIALDPISEASPIVSAYPYLSPSAPATASASGLGPALSSPSIAIEAPSPPSATNQHSYPPTSFSKPPSTRQINRPPNIGIGKPSSRMFLNLNENNAELILYSYAQLKGTVTLNPLPSNTFPASSSTRSVSSNRTFSQSPLLPSTSPPHMSSVPPLSLSAAQIEQQKAQTLAALRQALLKGSATAVGGGSMDITSRTHSRTPSASGATSLGAGFGSGTWGSFGGSTSAGLVSAYGPLSARPSLGTIHSGSTEGPASPASPRRSHSRASSFSSGILSIFKSPFGGSGPVSAPPVTHPNNLAASISAPDVASPGHYSQQNLNQQQVRRPTRNRTASAGVVPSVSSGWPSASPLNHPASAGLEPSSSFASFSAPLSSPGLTSGPGSRLGLGLGWPLGSGSLTEEIDPELPLPTFEAQSSLLAVDVSLEPGESKSYVYSILLPSNLPPTFRGRTLRFAYELVVGICRAGPSNNFAPSVKDSGSGGSVSKVMKVPIRVYTNVIVGRPPTPYDLLWPINKRRSTLVPGHRRGGKLTKESIDKNDPFAGKVVKLEVPRTLMKSSQSRLPTLISASDSASSVSGSTHGSGSLDELGEYAKRLVAELPVHSQPDLGHRFTAELSDPPTSTSVSSTDRPLSPLLEEDAGEDTKLANGHGNGDTRSPVHELAFKEKERIAKMRQREESDEPISVGGCGEAVEILTRNPKKVSYDVNKDGVKVAVLTFIKSAFRLGETIHGVVELNERQSRARVVQLSAHLETHESLPYPISTTPNTAAATRQLKRVHVEYHSSFVLSTLRTTFALDIPSDASPAFQIKVGDNNLHPINADTLPKPKLEGGLEWKVRLCLLVAVAKETSDTGTEGVRFKSLVRDGPRGEWGSAWKAPISAAPREKPTSTDSSSGQQQQQQQQQGVVKSWTSFIAASFLGAAEGGYHDGDELPEDSLDDVDDDDRWAGIEGHHVSYDGIKPNRAGGVGVGVNFGGGMEAKWQEVKLETVECEVPVRVWPGNTAFKPVDVVFDV